MSKYIGVQTGTALPPPVPAGKQTPIEQGIGRADTGNDLESIGTTGTKVEHNLRQPNFVSSRQQQSVKLQAPSQSYVRDDVTTLDRKFATGIWAKMCRLDEHKQVRRRKILSSSDETVMKI